MKNVIIWVIVLAGFGYGGAKLYLHHKVNSAMESAVLMLSPYADVQYRGVSSTLSGELTIDDVRANVNGFSDEIHIERLGIDTPSFLALLDLGDFANGPQPFRDGMPDYFGFLVEGVHVPASADFYQKLYDLRLELLAAEDADEPAVECTGKYGFSPRALAGLGYSEQIVSASATIRQDSSNYSLEINSSVEDMMDVTVSISLAGDMASGMSQGSSYRPKLSELEMVLTDHSINERVREYCERLGVSPEDALQAQLDAFHFVGEANGIEFDEYMVDPYLEFLAGKSKLVVTAQPHEPISLTQIELYKPSDVPALLNLSAAAR